MHASLTQVRVSVPAKRPKRAKVSLNDDDEDGGDDGNGSDNDSELQAQLAKRMRM